MTKINIDRAVVEQVLDAVVEQVLELLYRSREHFSVYTEGDWFQLERDCHSFITALRAALSQEQQEQAEPVAWMTHGNDPLPLFHKTKAGALAWGAEPQPLYTAPPQRKQAELERLRAQVARACVRDVE